MTTTLPIHLCPADLAPEQALSHDWFGQKLRYQARFQLSLHQDVLGFRFSALKPAQADPNLANGAFVEGLWQQDVGELFVMGPGGAYHEFNLSPYGAWWSASFSSYRQPIAAVRCPSARLCSQRNEQYWSTQIRVNLADIPCLAGYSIEQARLSVTAILDPDRPEYLCFGHRSGGEPDFHLASTFLPPGTVGPHGSQAALFSEEGQD